VNISGYVENEIAITEFDEERYANVWYLWKKHTTYSIKWKKGWNVWYSSASISRTDRTIKEKWTNISGGELEWYTGEELWRLSDRM